MCDSQSNHIDFSDLAGHLDPSSRRLHLLLCVRPEKVGDWIQIMTYVRVFVL